MLYKTIDAFVDSSYALHATLLPFCTPISSWIYKPAEILASQMDVSLMVATLFLCMQAASVLSFGLSMLKQPFLRKWYSTTFGVFLGFYLLGLSYFIVIAQMLCTYFAMVLMPTRRQAMFVGVGSVAIIMVLRNLLIWWPSTLDGTGRMQSTIIFMRTVAIMCNYMDAEVLDDDVKGKHLTARERKFAKYLKERPSFEDWCHYNFFLPFSFIGDFYDFGDYVEFINFRGDIAKMRPYSNLLPWLQRWIESTLCWFVFYQLGQMASSRFMATEEFKTYSSIYQFTYMLLAANSGVYFLFARFSYHEVGLIATGISYRQKTDDAPENYNSLRSVNLIKFQWASTPKDSIANWNMRTAEWLKYYVMFRLADRDLPRNQMQIGALMGTFAVSAGFHGFYHGYFGFFVGLMLIDVTWKICDSTVLVGKIRAKYPARIVTLISVALAQLNLRFLSVPFWILTWKESNEYYKCFGYAGFSIPTVILIVALMLPKQRKQQIIKKVETTAAEAPLETVASSTEDQKEQPSTQLLASDTTASSSPATASATPVADKKND